MTPAVSVIVPAYNSAKYIKQTIGSIFDQTFKDFEIIVIDDGSTDNTEAVLRPFLKEIRYVKKDNEGPSAARNVGISLAQGIYLSFLDADDLFVPEHLELLIGFLEEYSQLDFVFADVELFSGENVLQSSLIAKWKEIFYDIPHQKIDHQRRIFTCKLTGYLLKYHSFIHTSTMTIRRGCLRRNVWFRVGYHYSEDADCWARIAYHADGGYIDRALSRKRQHSDSLIHNEFNLLRNMKHLLELCEIQKEYFSDDPKITKIVNQKILQVSAELCWCLDKLGYMDEARSLLFRYLRQFPFSPQLYKILAKTFIPEYIRTFCRPAS